jgi:hypothetical protein
MSRLHAWHANKALKVGLVTDDRLDQAAGRLGRLPSTIIVCTKEITMRSHGPTTVWGTHLGVDHARDVRNWCQQLRDWWTAHNAARLEARRASRNARWDATRDVYRPCRADAALERAIAQGTLSMATHPSSLI